jgi:hypothetical protein
MPYHVGEKGSYGCSGYPAVKDDDGEVMGCHETAQEAAAQIAAIEANEKGIGIKDPEEWPGTAMKSSTDKDGMGSAIGQPEPASKAKSAIKNPKKKPKTSVGGSGGDPSGAIATTNGGTSMGTKADEKAAPCWDGYTQRGMKPGRNGRMVPNCVPVQKMDQDIVEGDFVMAMTTEGVVIGQVEHIMVEGGTYGQPGNPYSVESTPENPAVAVRILEEDDGVYYYTPYSIGALKSDVKRIDMPNISLEDYEDSEDDNYDEYMDKAEGYSPPAGARSAARRAIKFKEDGKATGAGTAVGWTRARQLANGETLSLSTVKRMYSYFSRHEVDKKGKDWGNQANPSNGYIMWLAWGGDAGYSWSRRIAQREADKALFSDFGQDFTSAESLKNIFKSDK